MTHEELKLSATAENAQQRAIDDHTRDDRMGDWPGRGPLTLLRPRGMSDYARVYGVWRTADGAVLRRLSDGRWRASWRQWTSKARNTASEAMADVDRMQESP